MNPSLLNRMVLIQTGALLAISLTGSAYANTTLTLQPDEASSKDVIVYEFAVPGTLGIPTPPRTTNLDTVTLNAITPPPVPFGLFLGAANTDPRIGSGGEIRAHDAKTLIQFDFNFLSINPSQVASASLNLFALDALPPFESPDALHPVTTDLHEVLQPWHEQSVTWENQPIVGADPMATVVQNGVQQWVSFDITQLVKNWLANPDMNYGVQLAQREVVEAQIDEETRYFGAIYASSAFSDATLRPYLSINASPVPVPAAFWLFGSALLGIPMSRIRKSSLPV